LRWVNHRSYTYLVKPVAEISSSSEHRRLPLGRISLVVIALIVVAFASWLYMNQHQRITSLNKRVSQLTLAKSSDQKQNSSLDAENKNLNKAVKLLQAQAAKVAANAPIEQAVTAPAVSSISTLEITSATNSTVSTYPPGVGQSWPANIPAIAVHITIHNQTGANQSYDQSQFGAVTDTGVVVGTFPWTPNISQTPWLSTTIVAGASLNETVYYSVGQNLSMLTWQPPGQSMVELPFPTVN